MLKDTEKDQTLVLPCRPLFLGENKQHAIGPCQRKNQRYKEMCTLIESPNDEIILKCKTTMKPCSQTE